MPMVKIETHTHNPEQDNGENWKMKWKTNNKMVDLKSMTSVMSTNVNSLNTWQLKDRLLAE